MNPVIYKRNYVCGDIQLSLGGSTWIMGIVNVTPDSFSDGGRHHTVELAVRHALQLMADGADLIDIGGESTRPGHEAVSLDEELSRVIPVVEALHREAPHIPLSVDTYKAEVARQSLAAGAHLINDVWGFKADPEMARVVAAKGCPVILMHNRIKPDYVDFIVDVQSDLLESVRMAEEAGVRADQIILDPGIGFAKNIHENLQMMSSLYTLGELGYPLLLGTSRKTFIRTVLDLPVDDVVEGTAATVAFGIAQGCQIVRVHDVRQIRRTVRMCDAMLYASAHLQVR